MRVVSALKGWLNLADYNAEREEATTNIVARFSRGNVSVQNGQVMDEAGLKRLSECGDRDLAQLNRLARHSRKA